MLIDKTLFEIIDKVAISIERLKHFEPEEGYYFANSGGKDSTVVRTLLIESEVRYDAHYMATTIDPPEIVQFIKKYHSETKFHYPPSSYFKEIIKRGFPMRQKRWCCDFLKEYGGDRRLVVTGIRHEESNARLKRRMMEPCTKRDKWYLNPIIDWTEKEVWEFIHSLTTMGDKIPYCKLYDEGWKRIGCLGCPMAYYKTRVNQLEKYPRIKKAYINAFVELWEKHKEQENYKRWNSGNEMFEWWLTGRGKDLDEMPLFT
jgi:phosphoadenosine phosphosulfate reductase